MVINLQDEAAHEQAATKKRNEVLISFEPKERRDPSPRRCRAAVRRPSPPPMAATPGCRIAADSRRRTTPALARCRGDAAVARLGSRLAGAPAAAAAALPAAAAGGRGADRRRRVRSRPHRFSRRSTPGARC